MFIIFLISYECVFFLHTDDLFFLLPLFFDVYLFLTICRRMKENTMADPEKFQETSEEVRHLENPISFQFGRLSLTKYFAWEMQFFRDVPCD